VLSTLVLGLVLPTRPVAAGTDIGPFCFQLNPFVDTLRLSATVPDGSAELIEIHGRWRADAKAGVNAVGGAGPAQYELLGGGTLSDSFMDPGHFDMGLQFVQDHATFFNGNFGCNFLADIDQVTLSGFWVLQCPGSTVYTQMGTFSPTACTAAQ